MSTALAHHHVAAAGGGGGGGGYDTSGPAAGNGVTNGHGGVTPNSNSSNDIKQVQVTTHLVLVAILLRFDVSFSNRPKEKDAYTSGFFFTSAAKNLKLKPKTQEKNSRKKLNLSEARPSNLRNSRK